MCSKMVEKLKVVKNNFFKHFTTNRKENYWPVVFA